MRRGVQGGALLRKVGWGLCPVLCVLVKAPEETLYTGLFLEHLTVDDLKRKIAERYHLDANAIVSLCRIGKRGTCGGGAPKGSRRH
jgi:hypothetical protein